MIRSTTKWKPEARGRSRQRWMDRVQENLKLMNVRNAEECVQKIDMDGYNMLLR